MHRGIFFADRPVKLNRIISDGEKNLVSANILSPRRALRPEMPLEKEILVVGQNIIYVRHWDIYTHRSVKSVQGE
ncbi:hypothetical protein BC351_06575 [Paenibacillus ferrarius]|uniref:Uncharacterized protein n=1 Tax=Paenibacillus ferrarius TaxID=1469647 RepID=A0A1V4HFJ0_9BACL|nr:hypothetical protein BC351_06575 [Paenibacillus ferrarius]